MEENILFSQNKNTDSVNIASKTDSLLPCLVCGIDLSPPVDVDCVIKQEQEVDWDDEDCIEQCYQTAFTNSNDRTFKSDNKDSGGSNGMDDGLIFQWFLKWFKVNFEGMKRKDKLSKGHRKSDRQGIDDDDDTLPFCGTCRGQLADMLELQLKLDELARQIENGIKKIEEKIQSSEVDFGNKGIYDRDPRYKFLRSKIIKSSSGEREGLSKISGIHRDAQKNTNGGRKSSRTKRPISRFTSGQDDTGVWDVVPVVMVSPIDKAIAEEHLLKIETDLINSSVTMEQMEASTSHKSIKKRRISTKNKNIKSTRANKKAKRTPPKNIKAKATRGPNLDNLKETKPTARIKEENENDGDWSRSPESPPAQDWDNLNKDSDSNSNDDCKEDPLFQPAPAPRRKQKRKKTERNTDSEIPEKPVKTLRAPPVENCDDDNLEEDNTDRKYRKFTEDPQDKSLSYGEFTFKLLDPQGDGEETQLQCITCSLVIPNKRSWVRAHVIKVHTNRFTCPHCPARFSKITNMRYHVQGVHQGKRVPQKKYICEICGAPMSGAIKAHKWTHKNKQEKEEALANNSSDVPDHYHDKLQCDECGQSFKFKFNLLKHIERHHSGLPRKLELCPECGGSYKELQAHLKYAHAKTETQRTWECTEAGCGKKFKRLSQLTRHKNVAHLKIKPFKCTLCPRTFGTDGNLKRHMNSHLGIRPFKCDSCPSAFITKSAVNTHRRIFHEEGSTPKRKSYVRGPCMLQVGVTQEELRKKKMYYPPSLIRGAGAVSRITGSSSQNDVAGYDREDEGSNRQDESGFL